jgi:hypothetical protein
VVQAGPRDKKVSLLIAGEELRELKRLTWLMSESFGLDRRIEAYRGTRPIGLYSWDFECLLDVIDNALKDDKEYLDKWASGYKVITKLSSRLLDEYNKAFGR